MAAPDVVVKSLTRKVRAKSAASPKPVGVHVPTRSSSS